MNNAVENNEPKIYCAMLTTGICDLPSTVEALKAQLDAAQRAVGSDGALFLQDLVNECSRWKSIAKASGVCLSCAYGGAVEPYGCTDCLNTGWDYGSPAGFVPEAQLAALQAENAALLSQVEKLTKALKPFADEANVYEPDEGDGDDVVWATPVYFKIRDLRNARAALEEKSHD